MNNLSKRQQAMIEEKQKVHRRVNTPVDPANYECIPAKKQVDYYDNDIPQRVAVYARVSTDNVQQTSSYELQKKYYEEFVIRHPNWTLVKIYADVDSPYGLNPKARECLIMMARTGFFVFYRRGLFDNPQMCWEHFINLLWRKELLLFGFEGFLCD